MCCGKVGLTGHRGGILGGHGRGEGRWSLGPLDSPANDPILTVLTVVWGGTRSRAKGMFCFRWANLVHLRLENSQSTNIQWVLNHEASTDSKCAPRLRPGLCGRCPGPKSGSGAGRECCGIVQSGVCAHFVFRFGSIARNGQSCQGTVWVPSRGGDDRSNAKRPGQLPRGIRFGGSGKFQWLGQIRVPAIPSDLPVVFAGCSDQFQWILAVASMRSGGCNGPRRGPRHRRIVGPDRCSRSIAACRTSLPATDRARSCGSHPGSVMLRAELLVGKAASDCLALPWASD